MPGTSQLLPVIAAVLLPFILNLIFTPIILVLSKKFQWFDRLESRKVHNGSVSRLGGVGFFLSFLITIIVVSLLWAPATPEIGWALIISGFALVHLLGLVDDFRNIPAIGKFLGQILAAALVTAGGLVIPGISLFGNDLFFGYIAYPLTVLWLISFSNAVNLIDGVDGLAGSISFVAVLFFGLYHLVVGNISSFLVCLALAGAVAGFLVFNLPPARIFMGDSGSLFLGFAVSIVLFSPLMEFHDLSMNAAVLVVSLLALPIVDMAGAIVRRLRKGVKIYMPDREHLHHKLLAFGYSVPRILFLLGGITAAGGLCGLVYVLGLSGAVPVWPGITLLAVYWAGILAFFGWIHFKHERLVKKP